MIKTVKEANDIAKRYNSLKTDMERLYFLKEQKGNLKVVLDNDMTMVEFDEIEDEEKEDQIREIELESFDYYHGWTDGVIQLFEFAGITAESC